MAKSRSQLSGPSPKLPRQSSPNRQSSLHSRKPPPPKSENSPSRVCASALRFWSY